MHLLVLPARAELTAATHQPHYLRIMRATLWTHKSVNKIQIRCYLFWLTKDKTDRQ